MYQPNITQDNLDFNTLSLYIVYMYMWKDNERMKISEENKRNYIITQ